MLSQREPITVFHLILPIGVYILYPIETLDVLESINVKIETSFLF